MKIETECPYCQSKQDNEVGEQSLYCEQQQIVKCRRNAGGCNRIFILRYHFKPVSEVIPCFEDPERLKAAAATEEFVKREVRGLLANGLDFKVFMDLPKNATKKYTLKLACERMGLAGFENVEIISVK